MYLYVLAMLFPSTVGERIQLNLTFSKLPSKFLEQFKTIEIRSSWEEIYVCILQCTCHNMLWTH